MWPFTVPALPPHLMKHIEAVVAHTVKNYLLTSQLQLHRRLRPENTKEIAKAVANAGQTDLLLELIRKRDHYAFKIHALLNSAGEQTDPELISDRNEAEHYIARRILLDRHKADTIRTLVEKHAKVQKQFAEKVRKIVEGSKPSGNAYKGLQKLHAANARLEKSQQLAKDEELAQLYQSAMVTQRELSEESDKTLRTLGVPFFAAHGAKTADKVFVLEVLQTRLSEPQKPAKKSEHAQNNLL